MNFVSPNLSLLKKILPAEILLTGSTEGVLDTVEHILALNNSQKVSSVCKDLVRVFQTNKGLSEL